MAVESTRETTRRRYLHAMGVDVWLARGKTPEASAAIGPESPPKRGAIESPAPTIRDAGAALDTLAAEVAACRRCPLHATRKQTVFGVGAAHAGCMVIGEAPGADEDAQGEPFVGRAGRLLNAMLRAIGLTRDEVYIANIVKCRPPKNRDPRPEEMAACAGYLRTQIALVRPRVILAVGRVAAQNLVGAMTPIGKMRGREYRHAESDVPILVTYHPAYLLRSPLEKRKVWDDLKRVRSVLEAGR